MTQKFSNRLLALLSSRKFFWGVIVFFVFESVWIAVSARYPMAFDEDFHFGILKLYAGNHFSPFFASQPAGGDAFGAVARDPSYLYHYLISFPYRLVSLLTDSQMAQVVILRCVNVALFAGGLIAFRKLFLRAKLSPALAHVVLTIFVLIPIVPLLAGQINYDNLLILTVPLTLLLAISILDGIRAQKIHVAQILFLGSVLFLESLVKYSFLPIAGAVAGYLTYRLVRSFWARWSTLPEAVVTNYRQLSSKTIAGLAVLLVVSMGLFVQRYGVNALTYRTALPDCAVVLTEAQCHHYVPWARNHELVSQKVAIDKNPLAYANLWFHAMLLRSVFAINGPFSDYTNYFPLWLPQATIEFLCLVSVVLAIFFAKKLFARHPELQLLAATALLYLVVLVYTNYKGYLHTGEPVAVNGRYLLLVLPLVLAIAALAFVCFLRKLNIVWFRPMLATVIIMVLLQGGGFVTFILQSDATWYWSGNRTVEHMNSVARTILRPLVYEKPAERFLKYE